MSSLTTQAQAIVETYLPQHDETFRQIRRSLARGGRPCSLTPDIIDQLGDAIAETAEYIEDACLAYGIPRRNYYNWLKQGERDDEEDLDTIQASFWRTLKAAESQGMVKLGRLWVANPRDFAAFATRKERKAPGKWARRDDGHDGPRLVVQIGVAQGEVKVGLQLNPNHNHNEGLSPGYVNELACGNVGQVEIQSPINGDYVNQRQPMNGAALGPAPGRAIPAGESEGGPIQVALASGQHTPAPDKGPARVRRQTRKKAGNE